MKLPSAKELKERFMKAKEKIQLAQKSRKEIKEKNIGWQNRTYLK